MCLEVHNQTLYQGLTNHLYRLIDREATKRVVRVLSPECPGVVGVGRRALEVRCRKIGKRVVKVLSPGVVGGWVRAFYSVMQGNR